MIHSEEASMAYTAKAKAVATVEAYIFRVNGQFCGLSGSVGSIICPAGARMTTSDLGSGELLSMDG